MIGSIAILTYVVPVLPTPLLRNLNRGTLALELGVILTFVISAIAIPLGFTFMYFFGGVVSTRVIRIYLLITRGKHIVLPKNRGAAPIGKRERINLKLDRQLIYFLFIFAVVVSFASYLA